MLVKAMMFWDSWHITARQLRQLLIKEYYEKIKNAPLTKRVELKQIYAIALGAVTSYNDEYRIPPHVIGRLNTLKYVTDAWNSRQSGEEERHEKRDD